MTPSRRPGGQPDEEFPGFRFRQDVQGDRSDSRFQFTEVVAAGDQDETDGAFGQQRLDLARIAGVVQDQQGLLILHAVSPVPDPFIEGGGQVPGVHPDRGQQHPQCLEWGCGVLVRCVAMQVHLQLPVGEAVLDQVGQVHGQRGLADPGIPSMACTPPWMVNTPPCPFDRSMRSRKACTSS